MARNRNKPKTATTEGENTIMATNDNSAFDLGEAIDETELNEIMASGRVRGAGEEVLRAFLAAEIPSIKLNLSKGPFAGKSPEKAATSINNAKKKTTDAGTLAVANANKVRVFKRKDKDGNEFVALVNTDLVTVGA